MPRATRARAAKGALREKSAGEVNVEAVAPDAKAVGAVKAQVVATENATEAARGEWSVEKELKEIDDELDKQCGNIMKSAEDFAVEIRKQLKKDIVKIPKKIRSMSLKDFFEKYGNDLGEDMLTDIKVRLGLLPPEEARTLNVPEPSPAKATTPAPASMAPPPPKALDSAPKAPPSMPPPPPMFNNAPVAATPVGKKARTEGGLSDAVGGTFAVPSTPKGAGITVPQTSGSGKIVVNETPGTKRRVKRGEMLYSANGSPLGEGRRVDSGDDDESPVAGASAIAPPSAVKKITMSVKKRTREDTVGGDDHNTGSELPGLVIQTDDGDEIDLGALAGADPDKEGAEKALGVLQNLQANVAAMMVKLQRKQGDA